MQGWLSKPRRKYLQIVDSHKIVSVFYPKTKGNKNAWKHAFQNQGANAYRLLIHKTCYPKTCAETYTRGTGSLNIRLSEVLLS